MTGQLNIKLLVVHNFRVLLIFLDFIEFCLFPDSCNFLALGSILQEKVSCTRGNFHSPSIQLAVSGDFCVWPVFFSLYFKAKTQWNKGMSDFDSGNSVNCV